MLDTTIKKDNNKFLASSDSAPFPQNHWEVITTKEGAFSSKITNLNILGIFLNFEI